MEIDTKRLTPGMVLEQDVVGKSGKAIIAKNTQLTEVHIEFIQKFLIDKVSVSPLFRRKKEQLRDNQTVVEQKNQLYVDEYEQVVIQYKKLFSTWKNNVPIDMYNIRSICVPLFEKVIEQSIEMIINLTRNRPEKDMFYYKSVAISLLSVLLAHHLNYEKKDWLQIGFAALLSDIGMVKIDSAKINKPNVESIKALEMHPLYSYKMVEHVKTLTQNAKMAILQHHERLDGSGYPAKTVNNKIHPYARFIAVSDFFYSNYSDDKLEIINLLENQYGKLDEAIVTYLVNELSN